MGIKLKERLLRNRTFPTIRNSEKTYKKITGITSRNISDVSAESIAFEQSRAHLTQISEIEIKRSQAMAEAHRIPIR
jgi:hypothetical protein